jgi:hypothetical protein
MERLSWKRCEVEGKEGWRIARTPIVLGLLLTTGAAWAGPPFTTNDADPPDVGQWEFILPFTLKRARDGSRSGEFVTFDINYGYDKFTQLSVELPLPYTRTDGRTRSGVGDVLLEYKRRFGTDGSKGYFGVNPQLTLPSGDDRRGLGAGRVTAQLPLLYQKQNGRTLLYSDLRYKWRAGDAGKSFWFLGFAVERQVSERLEVGAELFGTTATAPNGKRNAGFSVCFKYGVSGGSELLVAAGRSLRGDPDLTLFMGLKVLTR